MHKIIALWTHPRSVSTAFERAMMERRDLQILHEPFSYLYYVHDNKAAIPQEYVDPNHPTTYPGIRDMILATAEAAPVFFKDMGSHCVDHLIPDEAFLARLTNTFLIRDPARTIASHYAMNPRLRREEIGYEQLFEIFRKVSALTGTVPVVIDADDLIRYPAEILQAYCEQVGIAFTAQSLQWDRGHKPEWDIWKQWHVDASQSTGFQDNTKDFETTVDNNALLKAYYDYQLPFYRALHECRIVATPGSDKPGLR